MFTGTEQLVAAFFEQVAGQLRLRGKPEHALAGQLIQYGQALAPLVWIPVAGSTLGRIASVANAAAGLRGARSRKPSYPVETQRQAIEEALGQRSDPILVIIDDLDRLTPAEHSRPWTHVLNLAPMITAT